MFITHAAQSPTNVYRVAFVKMHLRFPAAFARVLRAMSHRHAEAARLRIVCGLAALAVAALYVSVALGVGVVVFVFLSLLLLLLLSSRLLFVVAVDVDLFIGMWLSALLMLPFVLLRHYLIYCRHVAMISSLCLIIYSLFIAVPGAFHVLLGFGIEAVGRCY